MAAWFMVGKGVVAVVDQTTNTLHIKERRCFRGDAPKSQRQSGLVKMMERNKKFDYTFLGAC